MQVLLLAHPRQRQLPLGGLFLAFGQRRLEPGFERVVVHLEFHTPLLELLLHLEQLLFPRLLGQLPVPDEALFLIR